MFTMDNKNIESFGKAELAQIKRELNFIYNTAVEE